MFKGKVHFIEQCNCELFGIFSRIAGAMFVITSFVSTVHSTGDVNVVH